MNSDYFACSIPTHMIRGGMHVEAQMLLANRKFIKRRIARLGLPLAVERQIKDLECLLAKLIPGANQARLKSKSYSVPIIRQAYRPLLEIVKKTDEANGPEGEVSAALLDIGVSCSEWYCFEDAVDCWMECLLMSAMTLSHRREVLFRVARALEEMEEYEGALTFFNECLELQTVSLGDNHVQCGKTIQKIGDVLVATEAHSEAIEAYTMALGIFTKNNDLDEARIFSGDVQELLGRTYLMKHDLVISLEHYMKALQSKKQQYGKKNPALASIFNQIGVCVLGMDKDGDAKDAFQRSLSLVECDDAEKDLQNFDFLIAKGILGGIRGKKKVSDECFSRAIDIIKRDDAKRDGWKLPFVRCASEVLECR